VASFQRATPMPADSKPDGPEKILVLRGRQAVENYLANFPKPMPDSTCSIWLDKDAWLKESPDADEATWTIARGHELAALSAMDFDPDVDAASEIAPDVVRRLRAIPLEVRNGHIAVAMEDAGDRKAIEELNFICTHRVVPIAATAKAIREGIAHHYDRPEDYAIANDLGIDPHEARAELAGNEAERLGREQPVVRLVDDMISDAVRRRASDIHIRPGALCTEVLYRIDGAMVPVRRLMQALHPAAVARIKVVAEMNLAEHRRPQDGRTTFAMRDGRKVDLRVSVLPAVHGESVVLRLLDAGESLWSVDQLGLSPGDRQRLGDVMARSHGMFLTTGPTGSGKSTTLYAMLMELRKQHLNILTIEDPVEYDVDGVEQMQVNRAIDFTFASAMRNFLRHDPDVVMVGEIRDRETAGIAVESALTGHLLLSTLHTNSAATTVTRLLDLGIESYLLRTSLLAVMAQRLVRLTCEHCREPEVVDPHVRDVLGVAHDEAFFKGRGCPQCDGIGVHGRMAVYELLVVTPAMRKLIVDDAQADLMNQLAVSEGMTPITQAAVALAREGRISLAEAWRIRVD
jgi:type IV pilus assembly protein PilB